jgi:SAM-dependent methyltransferase
VSTPAGRPVSSAVDGDTVLQGDVLEDLVEARNYRGWLVRLTAPHLGEHPIEIGGGTGHYAQDWVDGGVPHLTTSEADPVRLAQLRDRFAGSARVTVRELTVPIEETADYSAAVACNVLEHIPDDVEGLRAFAGLVRPGGRVVVVVPAVPAAMSAFDRSIGHHRRYLKPTLRAAAEQAGLEVERLHYVNALGLIGWLLVVKLLGGRPKAGLMLTAYDRGVVPWLSRLERRFPPPVGQSLLLVARVTGSPGT